jgi:DNA-binding cell septation regulator SpoVG
VSVVVKQKLKEFGLLHLTTHEDRVEIDRIIEETTGLYCDEGAKILSDDEFREIVEHVLRRKRKKVEKSVEVV